MVRFSLGMELVADILSVFRVVHIDYLQILTPQCDIEFHNLFLKYERATLKLSYTCLGMRRYFCNSQEAQIYGVMHYV